MSVDPALVAAHALALHRPDIEVWVQWDGVTFTNETAYVLSASGVESADRYGDTLNAAEANIELDNTSRRYDPTNTASPIYSSLTHTGQAAYINLGYNGLLTKIGTFWVDDLKQSMAGKSASLRLLDRVSRLAKLNVSYSGVGTRLDNVVRTMLLAAGLTETTDFVLDVAENSLLTAAVIDEPLVGELQKVAIAEGGRVYVDPDGIIRFLNASNHVARLSTPLTTFTRSQVAYDVNYVRSKAGTVNRIVLSYGDRTEAATNEIVYTQVQPVRLDAMQVVTLGETVYFPVGCTLVLNSLDTSRWEINGPVDFDTIASIEANTEPDGSGTDITCEAAAVTYPVSGYDTRIKYVYTPEGSKATLVLRNYHSAPVYLTTLTINGKPARPNSPMGIQVDDLLAQQTFGEIIPLEMENQYLPHADIAVRRAQDILFFRSGLRGRVDLPAMDGVPFLHPYDAFAFLDDSVSPTLTTHLQVTQNDWRFDGSGGYTSALSTAPALPVSYQTFASTVPAATVNTPSTSTRTSPWYWGGRYETLVQSLRPRGYWRLGESVGPYAIDSSEYGNTGLYVASPTLGATGALTGVPDTGIGPLNGSSQYVYIPKRSHLDLGDVFTLSAWVKPGATGAVRGIVSGGNQAYYLRLDTTNNLNLLKSGTSDIVHSTIAVGSGWHHVVGTKNGSTVKLYIDGVDRTGTVTNATCVNISDPLVIGSDWQSAAIEFSNGYIDEVALFGYALTATQVSALYTAGTTDVVTSHVWTETQWS